MYEREMRMVIIKIIIYALFSSLGLFFLKTGAGKDFGIFFSKSSVSLQMNYRIILGLFFYIVSFLLSLSIMKEENLSIFYSVSSGLAYIFVGLLSYFILKEYMPVIRIMGMGFILFGILLMNVKK